jgi:signal peptidase I
MSATNTPDRKQQAVQKDHGASGSMHWSREGVESIIIAVILALLFRTFEAEAFVIPTGSMAPTLQGRHKDVACPECGYRYRSGASLNSEAGEFGPVVGVTCPLCRFSQRLDPSKRNHDSFSGDRILVNKFAYQFGEPKRWDVIVFKYPGNAKQNYIKRLVGLPNETLRIKHGDVYVRQAAEEGFTIARKPPAKIEAMLQLVSDTQRIPASIVEADWPPSWIDLDEGDGSWETSEDRREYSLGPTADAHWLRYRQVVPTSRDWNFIRNGSRRTGNENIQGELISDYYAYNDYRQSNMPPNAQAHRSGWHWVGDLALECTVDVQSDNGELLLDLVEAGEHYTCAIDVATGTARLSIAGAAAEFLPLPDASGGGSAGPAELTATTSVKGPGKYRIRFANIDDQLLLWVGRHLVTWTAGAAEHPGHFVPGSDRRPHWSSADPGDLMPLGVGGKNIEMNVSRLRVLRDIYYIAASSTGPRANAGDTAIDYLRGTPFAKVKQVFGDPSAWSTTDLFDQRASEEFQLAENQYFPMGDNNPQSKDARLWAGDYKSFFIEQPVHVDHYITSELLIGKAFLVYWPHGWNVANMRLPIVPNLPRMGRIK